MLPCQVDRHVFRTFNIKLINQNGIKISREFWSCIFYACLPVYFGFPDVPPIL